MHTFKRILNFLMRLCFPALGIRLTLSALPLLSAQAQATSPIPIPRPEVVQAVTAEIAIPLQKPNIPVIQKRMELSLREAIFIGLGNNRKIETACILRYPQRYNLKVEEAQFVPQFSVSGELSQFAGRNQNTTRSAITPQAQLKTPTGAQLKFAWNNGGSIRKELQGVSSIVEITAEQPLLKGRGTEVNLAPLQIARLAERANILRLNATIAEVVGAIIFSYRDLLLTQEELKLAKLSVQRAEKLVENNEALINAGRMAPLDIIQTQADLENQRLRVLQAMQNLATAKLKLADLLALKLDNPIVVKKNTVPDNITININQLIPVALANRPDYLGQLNTIAQTKHGLIRAENEKLWDLKLFARGRYGLESSSHSNFQNVSDATVGLRFNLELNNPAPQRDFIQASSNREIAYVRLFEIRQGLEKQIRGTASEVRLLWKQIKLAETAEELARKAVEVELAKLNAGRSTSFQVRTLEDRLRDSETQLLAARIGYQNALTRLDLQLGTTLKTWGIDMPNFKGNKERCH